MGSTGMVNIELRQIIANVVNFLILFFIIKHFFYNKIKAFLNARSAEIEGEMSNAEKQRQEAETYRREYMEKLEKIDQESREIIREATSKANEKRNEIVKLADQEADRILERKRTEIKREKEKALEGLKNDIVTLSVLAATKVVEAELDEKKHHQLILNFIEEVGEVQ